MGQIAASKEARARIVAVCPWGCKRPHRHHIGRRERPYCLGRQVRGVHGIHDAQFIVPNAYSRLLQGVLKGKRAAERKRHQVIAPILAYVVHDGAFDPTLEWLGLSVDTFDGLGDPDCG